MEPQIFFNNLQRTVFSDNYYSVIGRALTIASRYEKLCQSMTAILKLKAGIIPLDDDDSLKKFSDEISRTTLNNHIKAFAFDNDLYHILKAAKDARNEIAHEISVGCDMLFDSKPEDYLNQFIEQIRKLIINIAKGDRIISMLLSVATYEEVPGSMLLENYPESVANWVVNMDD